MLISVSHHELKSFIETAVEKAIDTSNINQRVIEEENEHLTIKEASTFTNIAVATLYDYTHKRKIPFNKVGKKLIFSKKELTAWIQSHRKKTMDEIEQQANQR